MKKIILDCDPGHDDAIAIAIALEYGGPLLLCGLDVTHQFQATPERIQTVHDVPGTLAAVLDASFDVVVQAIASFSR